MADAPGHRLGQIIGDALEASVAPVLLDFAQRRGLYLDTRGPRPARSGRKVTWTDAAGNRHDLDFVLERGGTVDAIGHPAAFIETAWRRYTKHSKNKAQEIQGAIQPLCQTYANDHPFAGAVVAGEWTESALTQLRSVGFSVLHITYEEVVDAFSGMGLDVAYDEGTGDEDLRKVVAKHDAMSAEQRLLIPAALQSCAPDRYRSFIDALAASVGRVVEQVTILPLHGQAITFESVEAAVAAVDAYPMAPSVIRPFDRFEVIVRYSNGDRVEGNFQDADAAIGFLRLFE